MATEQGLQAGRVQVWAIRLAVPVIGLAKVAVITPPAHSVPAFTDQTGMPCWRLRAATYGLRPRVQALRLYPARHGEHPAGGDGTGLADPHRARSEPGAAILRSQRQRRARSGKPVRRAGGLGQHLGGFAQVIYDGVARQFHWDNLDVRLVNQGTVAGADAIYGLSLNNAPMVQDVWSTSPAWSFPYTAGALAPTPGASPLIDGGLAQEVIGVTAYGCLYVEAGGYSTPAAGTLNWLGADPGGGPGLYPWPRTVWPDRLAADAGRRHRRDRHLCGESGDQSRPRPHHRPDRPLCRCRHRCLLAAPARLGQHGGGDLALHPRGEQPAGQLRSGIDR